MSIIETRIVPWRRPDFEIKVLGEDESELLVILSNGTVRGSVEDAGPAAQKFLAELRGLTNAIRAEALREAADIVGSEEAEQWRRDHGGAYGLSAPGAQIVAQRMQIVGGIIRARADKLDTL